MFSNPEVAKSSNDFYCNFCDYSSSKLFNYKKHTATSKHKIAMVSNPEVAKSSNEFYCNFCDYRSSKLFNYKNTSLLVNIN